MKKIFAAMALFGGLTLAAADPYFDTTIKYVDYGGEILTYANITVPLKSMTNIIAKAAKIAGKENTSGLKAIEGMLRLMDLPSFKAFAQSSVAVEPNFYVYKEFYCIDGASKSIFGGKAVTNSKIKFLNLPADTRLAMMCNFNSVYIWKRINEEVAATGDKMLIEAFNQLKAEAQKSGINIDDLVASVNGPVFMLLTGNNAADLKAMLYITDSKGAVSTELRKHFPEQNGEKFCAIKDLPFPVAQNAQLIYGNGCVVFVSDPKILSPEKKLGDLPQYKKYAAKLPEEGFFMLVTDISQQFAENISAMMPPEAKPFFQPKPFSLVTVGSAYQDGIGTVIASSFSVPMSIFTMIEKWVCIGMDVAAAQKAKLQAPAAK